MNHIILISLLVILGIFSTCFIQTSFAEDRIIIILPSISDPACAKDDTCFSPSTIYINVGDSVSPENHNHYYPRIMFGTPDAPEPSLFGKKMEEKGIYYYFAMVYPWAIGKIVVGIEDAPKQNYEDSKAKLEKIEQEMKQQKEIKELVNAKTYITELENRIKDLIKISRDLEFQIEQLKIENNNLKNKTLQLQESIKTKSKPIASFVDQTKNPQSYIDRYNSEPDYKKWFDENYPDYSIYEAVGKHEPVPDWIKNNAQWWSEGKITEEDYVKGIEYLVKEGIISIN